MQLAGSVVVQIGGDESGLDAAFARSKQKTEAFDRVMANALSGSAKAALEKLTATIEQTNAMLVKLTGGAANTNTALASVTLSASAAGAAMGSGGSAGAKAMADGLALVERNAKAAEDALKRVPKAAPVERPMPASAPQNPPAGGNPTINAYSASIKATVDATARAGSIYNDYAASIRGASDEVNHYAASMGGLTDDVIKHGEATKLTGAQVAELGHIMRSVIGTLMAGGSAFQALSYESTRIGSVLTIGTSGPLATIKAIGAGLGSLVKPSILTGGAIAASAGIVIASFVSWENQQSRLAASLDGLGRRAGVTLATMNAIAVAGARTAGISGSQGRSLAGQYASTGLNPLQSQDLIGSTAQFARATGQDLGDAGSELANAFTNPLKGADDLNSKLGFLDDRTKHLIETFAAQGDITRAQSTLFAAYQAALDQTTDHTWLLSKAWNAVANAASDAAMNVGHAIDRGINGPTPQEQVDSLERQRGHVTTRSGGVGVRLSPDRSNDAEIARLQSQIDRQNDAAAVQGADVKSRDLGTQADAAIGGILPSFQRQEDINNQSKLITQALGDPTALKSMNMTIAQATLALQALDRERVTASGLTQNEAFADNLAIRSINARTTAERAAIAMLKARRDAENAGADATRANALAQQAAAQIIAQTTRDAQDRLRDSDNERALAGLRSYQAQRIAITQQYNKSAEADDGDPDALANDALVRQNSLAALQQTAIAAPMREANDSIDAQIRLLGVQQSTFGGTTAAISKASEQVRLFNQFTAAGIDVNTAYAASGLKLTDAIAQEADRFGKTQQAVADLAYEQGKTIQTMDDIRGASGGFLDTFLGDIASGKKGSDALRDSIKGLGQDLLKIGERNIMSGLFGESGTAGGDHPGLLGGPIFDWLKSNQGNQIKLPAISAAASAMTTATMQVTAATVMINGATGGLANFADSTGGIGKVGKIGSAPIGPASGQPYGGAALPAGASDLAAHITKTAGDLGIQPRDLAAAMSYETGGTFDPNKQGPGGHTGLIQMGAAERGQYGWQPGQGLDTQFNAIEAYFKDRGLKPGSGMMDVYSTINAGRPGRYNASDAANGGAWGTVADKVNYQMAGHYANADQLLGTAGSPQINAATQSLDQLSASAAKIPDAANAATTSFGDLGGTLSGLGSMLGSAVGGKGGGAAGGLAGGLLGKIFGGLGGLFSPAAPLTHAWQYAAGGIATPFGPVANLPRFAGGGTSNTASIFAEAGPEAAVPLPDGRSIPVTIRAPKMAAPNRAPVVAAHTFRGGDLHVHMDGEPSDKTLTTLREMMAQNNQRQNDEWKRNIGTVQSDWASSYG